MTSAPAPGMMTAETLETLIGPVQHFRAFIADAMTLRSGSRHRRYTVRDRVFDIFDVVNSMGSGGSALHGNTGTSVVVWRGLTDSRPYALVRKKSRLDKVAGVVGLGAEAPSEHPFWQAHVLKGDVEAQRQYADEPFLATLAGYDADWVLEIENEHVVAFHRPATDDARLSRTARQLDRLIDVIP